MEDYDRIEVAYILNSEPSVQVYASLFDGFPQRPGPEYGPEEFNINYWTDDGEKQHEHNDAAAAAEAIKFSPTARIGVSMGRYEIQVTTNRTDSWLLSEVPHVTFSAEVYSFEQPDDAAQIEDAEHRRREFVQILADAAAVLEPKWGFGRRGGIAIDEDDSIDSLSNTPTPPLYEYNVFPSETVDRLGRERLRSAPVWFVEELDTGAIFLAVREPPKSCSQTVDQCLDVADYLGVSLAEPVRYH